jgi:hypothetical protein
MTEEASFLTVIVWRDQAEHASQSLSKSAGSWSKEPLTIASGATDQPLRASITRPGGAVDHVGHPEAAMPEGCRMRAQTADTHDLGTYAYRRELAFSSFWTLRH